MSRDLSSFAVKPSGLVDCIYLNASGTECFEKRLMTNDPGKVLKKYRPLFLKISKEYFLLALSTCFLSLSIELSWLNKSSG